MRIKTPSRILIFLSVLAVTILLLIHLVFQESEIISHFPYKSETIQREVDHISPHNLAADQGIKANIVSKGEVDKDQLTNSFKSQTNVITKDKIGYTIILWTNFFSQPNYIKDEAWKPICDYKNCLFTSNQDHWQSADGLMFHVRDLNLDKMPKIRFPNQRWILLNHESPPHTPVDNMKALEGKINWTVTYRLNSDVQLSPRFVRSPKVLPKPVIEHKRPGSVSWMVSHCSTEGNREAYVDELKKYIPVDIYGSCGKLQCLPRMSNQCYQMLSKKYYFYLSFENSICPDYVTEKFFSITDYSLVPIVFGGADYEKQAPPNSFIDALSFETPQKLAEYLTFLIKHPTEYDKYFDWKRFYVQQPFHYACDICKLFNRPQNKTKIWNNLVNWWFKDIPCKRWEHGKGLFQQNDYDFL